MRVGGKANPEFFRRAYETIMVRGLQAADAGEALPTNLDKLREFIDQTAKSHGFDPQRLQDRRSDGEILADAIGELQEDPDSFFENEVWARIDKLIDAIEIRQDEADEGCEDYLNTKREGARQLAWGKAMRRRAERLRRLRERAKMPVPPTILPNGPDDPPVPTDDALEAAHPLRFMAYVGRSNMETVQRASVNKEPAPHEYVYQWGPHHYKMASDIWIARNQCAFELNELGRAVAVRNAIPYQGAIIIMPVGHGKTEFACAYMALEVSLRPRVQGVMLHAVDEKAWENLQYVESYYDKASDFGRRCKSLFPDIVVTQSTNKRFRVDAGQSLKSPTLTASGINKASLGSNTTFQLLDDVVPQSDAEQPTERDRRKRLLGGTWGTRQRGSGTFRLVIGTLWHAADALMDMMGKARRFRDSDGREGVCYLVSKQACGGPAEKFKPLWTGVYTSEHLRRKYYELGPALYSAAYMSNPLSDEQRLVKKLRLYDPTDSAEAARGIPEEERTHAKFLRNCVRYLSLDPSATNNERSDKAGVLYGGMGAIGTRSIDMEGNELLSTDKRLRIIDSFEIGAVQSELVDHALNYAMVNPVDYVIVEARSAFNGTAEMFEGRGVDVIREDPKNKQKVQRLRSAAVALEDANAPNLRAAVEFPGIWRVAGKNVDGSTRMELVIDPRFEGLAKQVLDFGVAAEDHSVDCLTQLVNRLLPDLSIGRGAVTEQVRREAEVKRDPRLAAVWARFKKSDGKCSEIEEQRWIARNWSS
jgi:hypothetical protein